ncbi:MAG: flagellar M-ring protein FliF [Alphaproteobacteria bacterium]|nr:flagellar M-ring protein FliF [Alphaproteobacteria bacterium]
MQVLEFFRTLGTSLLGLGIRRLVALGLAGVSVFALVGVSSYLLSRPEREVLYSGLDAQDITRIGSELSDAGISFDVSATGDTVVVSRGYAAKARMLLAQRGLPRSGTAGYELFDKMGSIGLTSFMQQVTKVRALEGELARTIQLMEGIKTARVHLAMRTDSVLRSGKETAAASVVIRKDGDVGTGSANAIRHLVAAAVPGLAVDQVTVMSTDGALLSSSDDSLSAAPEKLIDLERVVSADVERNIARTLTPYLGLDNFRISVAAKLNADHTQISETVFDPNSRVERSIRSVKESGEAENANAAQAVSVDQNIPQEDTAKANGDSSKEKKDRREELTNFEINSKSTATSSEGYQIEALSIAVVVNRAQLSKTLGDTPSSDAITSIVGEIEQLVRSAAGVKDARGDQVTVTSVDFVSDDMNTGAAEGNGLTEVLRENLGTLINAGALLLVALLVLLLGLRPALKLIVPPAVTSSPDNNVGFADVGNTVPLAARPEGLDSFEALPTADPLLEDLAREVSNSPRDRLTKIVELDPDRAAEVLRQWLNDPARFAT